MSTHSAIAVVHPGKIDALCVRTEHPGVGEILLKVEYSSMVAFDTYMADLGYAVSAYPVVLGFNAAGIVEQVGSGVDDLAVGDRVVAYSFGASRSKGMQEYSVLLRAVCSKIPDTLPLEAAATIPDNLVAAFCALFSYLSLPVPSSFPATASPQHATTPILIYGAGSTVGQYAIQLLHAAGYKKILATASTKHHQFLRSLGATDLFDYNSPSLVKDISAAAGGDGKLTLAMDCIAAVTTMDTIAKIISPSGKVALLLPTKLGNTLTVDDKNKMTKELPGEDSPFPRGTKIVGVQAFLYLGDVFLKDNLMPKILPSLLESEVITPNRVRLLDQGTFKERVEVGLDLLRHNKISGEKIVVKIP